MRLYDSETGEPIVWRYSQDETYHMSCWDAREPESTPEFEFDGKDADRIMRGTYVCCHESCNRNMRGVPPPQPPSATDHFI